MTRAEEVIREKISEKQAEQEAKQAEMAEFAEIKVDKKQHSCLLNGRNDSKKFASDLESKTRRYKLSRRKLKKSKFYFYSFNKI